MSDKLPQNYQNEEVDLVVILKLIWRGFSKVFNAIGNLFKSLFKVLIYLLKPIVENIKLIAIILMAVAVLGYVAEKFKEPVYVSDMLVRPYYDSKYQLANNVNYFNALIGSQNYSELSEIFEIDSTSTVQQLLGFEIQIGPETPNDLLKQYDNYIKSIDSTLAVDVTYEDFIENRDILAGSIFSIKAKATSNDIFPSLEKGFTKTLENQYSKDLKKRTDSIRNVKRRIYQEELDRVKNLQETYLQIKTNESNKGEVKYSGNLMPLVQEKTQTREYELFQEELKIRNALRVLEEEQIAEGEFFDILSGFEEVGAQEVDFLNRYSIIFPALAFFVMILVYFLFRIFKFIKEYE